MRLNGNVGLTARNSGQKRGPALMKLWGALNSSPLTPSTCPKCHVSVMRQLDRLLFFSDYLAFFFFYNYYSASFFLATSHLIPTILHLQDF